MKKRTAPLKALCALFLFFLSALALQTSKNTSTDAALSQAEPQLFGPGVISTSDFEFNATFSPDGNTVYFSKSDPIFYHITIVLSHKKNGHWTEPEVAPFSGIWKDTDPFVAPDGKKLFFISTRPVDGGTTPRKDYDIWYVELTDANVWGPPKHLGSPINSDESEVYPSVTRDGTLYFCVSHTDRPGSHIYRSVLINGKYGAPEMLPFSSKASDIDPTIAADESFIVFSSRDRGGLGQGDIYISFRTAEGNWSSPQNLGPKVNSPFHEIATGLSPDNRTLYFASNRIDTVPVRTHPITYQELQQELHSIKNGLFNIYEVDITDLEKLYNSSH